MKLDDPGQKASTRRGLQRARPSTPPRPRRFESLARSLRLPISTKKNPRSLARVEFVGGLLAQLPHARAAERRRRPARTAPVRPRRGARLLSHARVGRSRARPGEPCRRPNRVPPARAGGAVGTAGGGRGSVAGEGRTAAMRRPERGAPWRGRSHSRAFSSLSSLRLHSSLHPSPLASPPLSPLRIRRPARREHGGRRPVPGAGGVATTRPPMRRSASGRGRWQHDDEQGAPPVPTSASSLALAPTSSSPEMVGFGGSGSPLPLPPPSSSLSMGKVLPMVGLSRQLLMAAQGASAALLPWRPESQPRPAPRPPWLAPWARTLRPPPWPTLQPVAVA